MRSDFEGLKHLLEKDLERFLNDMKDTLIPMLDVGLEEKLKADLIRAVHALKALSGMFEFHQTTEFIFEVEMVMQKIFDLNKKDIANDLLNDMFEIKDHIDKLFRFFLNTGETRLGDDLKELSKARLDEFSRHYVEYKIGRETINTAIQPKAVMDNNVSNGAKESHDEFYVKENIMYLSPESLRQGDAVRFQEKFVSMLDNVKQIDIDLSNTNKLDFTGIQFIQSIKKHCKVSGMKFNIVGQSDLVVLETGMLGVEL